MVTNWKKQIEKTAAGDEIIDCTLSDSELVEEFHNGFGGSEGKPFTAWSAEYVYFPAVQYGGFEWVERVRRNPCDEAMNHVGGQ